jgi:peptide/nickel transport system substrate-binding protein/oligopeptide transport system substrate-binding protein
MKRLKSMMLAAALALGLAAPAAAQTLVAPGQSTTGTYMDYMKTVYARATFAELLQLPLTSFDKDFKLTPLAAESWSQSADGLTWTFKLRQGLTWSDGVPLTAEDYVFALQRAATEGYDFAWYWDFAGGIKNWKDVTDNKADVATLGLKAVDANTIEVTTAAPKPVETTISSGPFKLKSWEKSNNSVVLVKNDTYTGPWPAQIDELDADPTLGSPDVGLPAFLAGEADYSYLNAGQIPVVSKQFPNGIRKNPVFAVSYISFDLDSPPFNNADVRRALYYAVNRDELSSRISPSRRVRSSRRATLGTMLTSQRKRCSTPRRPKTSSPRPVSRTARASRM